MRKLRPCVAPSLYGAWQDSKVSERAERWLTLLGRSNLGYVGVYANRDPEKSCSSLCEEGGTWLPANVTPCPGQAMQSEGASLWQLTLPTPCACIPQWDATAPGQRPVQQRKAPGSCEWVLTLVEGQRMEAEGDSLTGTRWHPGAGHEDLPLCGLSSSWVQVLPPWRPPMPSKAGPSGNRPDGGLFHTSVPLLSSGPGSPIPWGGGVTLRTQGLCEPEGGELGKPRQVGAPVGGQE